MKEPKTRRGYRRGYAPYGLKRKKRNHAWSRLEPGVIACCDCPAMKIGSTYFWGKRVVKILPRCTGRRPILAREYLAAKRRKRPRTGDRQ